MFGCALHYMWFVILVYSGPLNQFDPGYNDKMIECEHGWVHFISMYIVHESYVAFNMRYDARYDGLLSANDILIICLSTHGNIFLV